MTLARIALFGGTNGIGLEFLMQALEAGHSVSLLARTPAKIDGVKQKYPNQLNVVAGNVFDLEPVKKTIEGQEFVVVAIGATKDHPDTCSRGTKVVLEGMKQVGVKRILCVSSFGVGESKNDVNFVVRKITRLFLGKIFDDKEIVEKDIKDSGLDWTIWRPNGLVKGKLTKKYKVAEKISWGGMVTRPDVAHSMLQEVHENKWIRKAPTMVS